MSTLRIPTPLRKLTNNEELVEVKSKTQSPAEDRPKPDGFSNNPFAQLEAK